MTDVVLHADGSVTRPGPGFSADGLADEWVRNNTILAVFDDAGVEIAPSIIPPRPDVLSKPDLLVHPTFIARQAVDAEARQAALAIPTIQDVIAMLEDDSPGRAAAVQAKADARAAAL